ncbi:filamentous hemagglutinin N-terminal domain-containing protein [Chlorogloeopsis sp. ULAP02]|uniref:two-partner secretion domain-containing protein n=1 Tax=Chlorogloeopsis sp. ULAP02 TaxID=3107926 RepID=UPI003136205A
MKPSWSLFLTTLSLAILVNIAPIFSAKAQLTPDQSLGNESSTVSPLNTNIDIINGGATRGSNLFHSFQEFNVGENRAAYFSNPNGITNILTRVTGGNPSNIQGILGVLDTNFALGTANLFLINPNGINFGPNAQLVLGGSFFGSTASSIVFDNGVEFSAANPPASVLTVNIPVGLRFRDNPENITTNRSVVGDSIVRSFLSVEPGKTLALVGGNVRLDGGILFAPGGRIEVGGLSTAGTVGINNDGSLSFPDGVARGDVSFTNEAIASVVAGGRGDIAINARNLDLLGGSDLFAGIQVGLGTPDAQAGDIRIDATDKVRIEGISNSLSAIINTSGNFSPSNISEPGNAGNIVINVGSLEASGNFLIGSATNGEGDAGRVSITAKDKVFLQGLQGATTGVTSFVGTSGKGNGAEIVIDTRSLFLSNTQLFTSTGGQGNAGNIKVKAIDSISVNNSTLSAASTGQGNAGNITIGTTSSPKVVSIQSSTLSTTNESVSASANEPINAGDISIDALDTISIDKSVIQAFTKGFGNAGNVTLQAENGNISLTNGSFVFSTVEANAGNSVITQGNAGKINVVARNLTLSDGSQVQTLVRSGKGNAGDITIKASGDVLFSGYSTIDLAGNSGFFRSGIFSSINTGAEGKGGNINIFAGSLSMNDSSLISTATFGLGDAGNILVNVDGAIKLANSSYIVSNVGQQGEGLGGDINIKGRSLTLTEGAQIQAAVFREEDGLPGGKGKAGDIDINTTDFIDISGVDTTGFSSGLFASAERGTIATQPQAAGDITVTTGDFRIADGAVVNALTSNTGDGGNITIKAKTFTATGGGQLLTTTFSSGRAGDITLKISDNIIISGSDPNFNQRPRNRRDNQGAESGIFANTAPGSTGKGGDIFIDPEQVTIKDGGTITATSAGTGEAGNITLVADNLTLDRGTITAESGSTTGGNINLDIKDLLLLRRNSLISATAGRQQNAGDGGNVNIDTGFLVAFPKENSDITANAFTGSGGSVDIQAESIFGIEPRDRLTPLSDITASSELGVGGTVSLNTPEVDPSKGLVELPETVVDPQDQIAQNPCQKIGGSEFIITGRGGLPPSPNESLSSDNVRVDLVQPAITSNSYQSATINQPTISSTTNTKQVVPAQGWVFNNKGDVVLTAYDSTATEMPQRASSKTTAACPAPF